MKSLPLIAAEHLLLLDQPPGPQTCFRPAPTSSEAAERAEAWVTLNLRKDEVTPRAAARLGRQLVWQAVLQTQPAQLAQVFT